MFKKILKISVIVLLIPVVYVATMLCWGTFTDFQPEERITLLPEGKALKDSIDKDTLSFFNWNVGYAGLGAESDFFYDDNRFFFSGDKMVIPIEELHQKYWKGIQSVREQHKADFYLFQEVDVEARRSYGTNMYEGLRKDGYSSTYAVNFLSPRVPLPLCKPWDVIGKVNAGLGTYAQYQPTETVRLQYPGSFAWPERIFNLDRCMAVHRFPIKGGHELVVINSHNSAYDKGGVMKKLEMDYLKSYLMAEYAKGNYIVVGADWNQCPPGFKVDALAPKPDPEYSQMEIPTDFMPADWTWAFNDKIPTNRKLASKYDPSSTFRTVIDFYLISPNLNLLEVNNLDLGFAYSDHQPVTMRCSLKR